MEGGTDSAQGTWSVPECPFSIEYSTRVLDDIRLAVMDAFFSLPRGGAEIGGILLGKWRRGRVSILDHAALECEHALGPSFTLSDPDHARLAELLEAAALSPAGLRPVGWYHSHTRSEIFLSDADIAIHKRYFPEPWQVALVLKPHTFRPTRCGFFFREGDGSIRGAATLLEFELSGLGAIPAPGGGGRTPPVEPLAEPMAAPPRRNAPPANPERPPAAHPAGGGFSGYRDPQGPPPAPATREEPDLNFRPARREMPLEPPIEAFAPPRPHPDPEQLDLPYDQALAEQAPVYEPVYEETVERSDGQEPFETDPRSPEPAEPEAPAPEATQPESSEPELPERPWPGMRYVAAAGLVLAVGAAVFETRPLWAPTFQAALQVFSPGPATPSLGLNTLDANGELQIRWDRNSPAVRDAVAGVLQIRDNAPLTRDFRLDASYLQAGIFVYPRQGDRVDVVLVLDQPNGRQVREVASFLGELPTRPNQPLEGVRREVEEQQLRRLRNQSPGPAR